MFKFTEWYKYKTLYYELLMAVSHKYQSETRHETALRYIKQAEISDNLKEQANV